MFSVIIPVFNERKTIETMVERVQREEIPNEIVIIDDGSTDGTKEWLWKRFVSSNQNIPASQKILPSAAMANPQVRVFFHETNQGKGLSLNGASRKPGEMRSSYRMPIWNIIPRTTRN